GLMAGARAEVDLASVLRRRLRVIGSVLRSRPREEKARLVAAFEEFAADRLADGRLRPLIDRRYPFERIAEAYAAMESGGLLGKIVVDVPGRAVPGAS
ncbi:MAG: zinc-binding dehydrogenase, partial [Thermoanaerobaculia bacterium]